MEGDIARAMAALTTGIYVLTVDDGERRHGMSSSWVTQVSGEPPLLMAAIDRGHFSNAMVARAKAFGLNVVGTGGRQLEDYFYSSLAKRADNLDAFECERSPKLKMPWLKVAMVSIEARVVDEKMAGDHTLFIAEPVSVRISSGERPLTSLDLDYVYVGGKNVIQRDRAAGW
jgi:flavin reductase (DIM6/NTAB) family NADH-FMN oxidoreductase RutF